MIQQPAQRSESTSQRRLIIPAMLANELPPREDRPDQRPCRMAGAKQNQGSCRIDQQGQVDLPKQFTALLLELERFRIEFHGFSLGLRPNKHKVRRRILKHTVPVLSKRSKGCT